METVASGNNANALHASAPLISIVVPVYRTEAYLEQCLESIQNQTYPNIEVLLIDDASPDHAGAICDAFVQKDPRFRVLHKAENEGVSAARNDGIALAKGTYLCFVDSDDWVEPQYCETLYHAASMHGADIGICGWYIHGRPDGRLYGGEKGAGQLLSAKQAVFHMMNMGHSFEGYLWNKIFPIEIFRETTDGTFRFRFQSDIAICEDLLFLTEVFASGRTAFYEATRLYHYRYRESGALRSFDAKRESEYTARERCIAICEAFDKSGLCSSYAALAFIKSALNNLTIAKQSHNRALAASMRSRIRPRIACLLKSKSVPAYEKMKVLVRWLFPVLSMRIWSRLGSADSNTPASDV